MANPLLIYGSLMPVDRGAPGMVMMDLQKHSRYSWDIWAHTATTSIPNTRLFNQKPSWWMLTLINMLPYRIKRDWFLTTKSELISYYIELALAIRKQRIPLAVVHVSYALCWIIKWFSPKTTVVYYHHGGNMHIKLDEKNWKRLCHAASQLIISVTQYAIEGCKQKFVTFPNRMVCIQNGKAYQSTAPKNGTREKLVLAYAGRFTVSKGIDKLLIAFNEMLNEKLPVELLLIGKLPDELEDTQAHKIHETYNKLPDLVKQKIKLTGIVNQQKVFELLTQADIALLLSQETEGNSLFGIESLFAGLPLIATNIGGNSELNEMDNPCCIFIPTDKLLIEHLKKSVRDFFQVPGLLDKYRRNASKRSTHFTVARMTDQFDTEIKPFVCVA